MFDWNFDFSFIHEDFALKIYFLFELSYCGGFSGRFLGFFREFPEIKRV